MTKEDAEKSYSLSEKIKDTKNTIASINNYKGVGDVSIPFEDIPASAVEAFNLAVLEHLEDRLNNLEKELQDL